MKKDTFLYPRSKRIENIVSEVIPVNFAKHGSFVCLQNISVTDETTAPAQIDIGFLRGADFIPVKSFLAPAAGYTVSREGDLWMFVDDQPAARVLGAVLGDNIQIVIGGYILYNTSEGE